MNKVILLVEDNPRDATLTERAILKSKIVNQVVVVHDGIDALDYLFGTGKHSGRDTTAQPAIVLLDLNLPKVDGFEVLRRLRDDARTKFVPVVILTSSTEPQDITAGYGSGANSYIRKPVDFREFGEVARQLGLYWLSLNEVPETL